MTKPLKANAHTCILVVSLMSCSPVLKPQMSDILFCRVTYLPVLSICDFDLYI